MQGLTFVLVAKWIVFTIFSMGYCYAIGHYFNLFFCKKIEYGIGNIAIGFTCLLSILQIATWFFVGYSLSFTIFAMVVSGIIIILIGGCFCLKKKFFQTKQLRIKTKPLIEERMVLFFVFAVFAVQVIMTFMKYRSDGDDSFYVSNSLMFLNEKFLNVYDSSMGIKTVEPLTMYRFQIWEALLSVFSKVFFVEPVVFAHTICIPVLLAISATAYLALGKKLFDKTLSAYLFYILVSVYHLMSGYSVYSQGSFLLSRIWQGKAVYLTVVLPVLMLWLLDVYEDDSNKMNYLKITMGMLAGLALNPTSIYILGFQMIAVMLVICLKKKSVKTMRFFIPAVILAFVFTLLIYLETNQYPSYIIDASQADWKMIATVFVNFFGSEMGYFALYLLSVLVILKIGNDKSKILFVYTSIVLFLFVWNPFAGKIIAQNVTKVPAFWRVYWLLPVGTSIACALVFLFDKVKAKGIKQLCFLLLCIGVMILPGKWMFRDANNFITSNNVEKLPDDVLTFGAMISKDGTAEENTVLAPYVFHTTMRQKYSNIELVISRYLPELYFYRGDDVTYTEKAILNNFIEGSTEFDDTQVAELLTKYSVKWIIMNNEKATELDFLQKNNYKIVKKEKKYTLLLVDERMR